MAKPMLSSDCKMNISSQHLYRIFKRSSDSSAFAYISLGKELSLKSDKALLGSPRDITALTEMTPRSHGAA